MSFIAQLSKLKSNNKAPIKDLPKTQGEKPVSLLPKNYVRQEDPAVARLKALRKQKEALTKKSKPDPPAKASYAPRNRKPAGTRPGINSSAAKVETPKLKKMSFDELMTHKAKEAARSTNDKTASSSAPRAASAPRAPSKTKNSGFKFAPGSRGSAPLNPKPAPGKPIAREKMVKPASREPAAPVLAFNTGFAKPSASLQKKLNKKQTRDDYEEESDMDDFIDDDEEEEPSYRSEIRAMFGRKRYYNDYSDDDDDDDMEAGGLDILEEEERATKLAKREDRMEEELERRRTEDKRKRLNR